MDNEIKPGCTIYLTQSLKFKVLLSIQKLIFNFTRMTYALKELLNGIMKLLVKP